MRWMGIVIWREIVGKEWEEVVIVEEVNEMDGGIVIWREIVGKEGCKVEEVNEMDGDSDLERDSWKRGL